MRLVVTLLAIVLGLVVTWAAFQNAGERTPSSQTAETSESAAPDAAPRPVDAGSPASADASSVAPTATPTSTPTAVPAAAAQPLGDLRIAPVPSPQAVSIGSADPASPFKLRIDLVPWGAGVQRMALADYRAAVKGNDPYVIHDTLTAGQFIIYPFAARSITINGTTLSLQTAGWQAGQVQTTAASSSVEYRITIVNADDEPVAEVVRRYELPAGSYDVNLHQRVINLTQQPLQVAWEQNIQGDLIADDAAYMGDRRMFVTGYFNPGYDPGRTTIYTDDGFIGRPTLLDDEEIWPNPHLDPGMRLAWLASENRYFAVVAHAPIVQGATTASVVELDTLYPHVGAVAFPKANLPDDRRAVVLTLASDVVNAPVGGAAEFPLAVYAGPRDGRILGKPPYSALHLDKLVRYELTCAICTFQWLAHGLLWFLTTIEGLLGDWGIAIIILVVVVRLLLHPITKQAQVGMMKMGKQMQALQPEIEKLKKKYGDDKQRINQEMMKLYREKGVNPANMLGCLPMFLQTPIWIALYAMLYFAIELRHEPAFYGVFQAISGGRWMFLADLSSPDHFIQFGTGFKIPLPFVHNTINGINLLPLLMAVVFYFQQRFATPPPANEQQAQQQKIMKFMVLLFPIFLYSAPSGLTLYILASTAAGVLDSYLVRKHVKEQEAAGTLFVKKPPKPGGFRDRMNKMIEEKQRQLMDSQRQSAKPKPPRGKRR